MPKQEFPFPMPNGWFCISRSDEIKPGEVKSLKFLVRFVFNLIASNCNKLIISILNSYYSFDIDKVSKIHFSICLIYFHGHIFLLKYNQSNNIYRQ